MPINTSAGSLCRDISNLSLKNKLLLALFFLFLFTFHPQFAFGYPEFSDDFESDTLDPFWDKYRENYGNITISTLQAHGGSKALKFTSISGGERSVAVRHQYPVSMIGRASVWAYDPMGGATLYSAFTLESSTLATGAGMSIQDCDATIYTAGCGGYREHPARSLGWHKYEIEITTYNVSCWLDGSVVFSSNVVFMFNFMQLYIAGPSWRPNNTFYYDDFTCNFTSVTPPSTPQLVSPANSYSSSQTTVAFDWNDSVQNTFGIAYYQMQVATASGFGYIVGGGTAAVSQLNGSLYSDVTYYWRVRARDVLGNYSDWSTAYSFSLYSNPPAPVTNLTATPLDGGTVRLDWTKSVSTNTVTYRIYYSTYSDSINYSQVMANIAHPAQTWTSPAFTPGKPVYFSVRAVNPTGNEENNTYIVSATPVTKNGEFEYSDNFDASSINSFWSKSEQYGTASLSTALTHNGARAASLSSVSGGQRYIYLYHNYSNHVYGSVTCWFYDPMGGQTLYAQMSVESATFGRRLAVGVVDWDAANYRAGNETESVTASVARSAGWHKFELIWNSTASSALIDDIVVYSSSAVPGSPPMGPIDKVQFELTGPSWRPNAAFYYDNFYCNVTTFTINKVEIPDEFHSAGSMNVKRGNSSTYSITRLHNGKILAAGGNDGVNCLSSAEIYDPSTGMWTLTSSMPYARAHHCAEMLPDGRVLIAGGLNSGGLLASAVIYNPASGTWSTTGPLSTARAGLASTVLNNGKVLAIGGWVYASGDSYASAACELYDPAAGIWSPTGSLQTARMWSGSSSAAIRLFNGKVLITGGMPQGVTFTNFSSTELYDPGTGLWSYTGSMAVGRRHSFSLTLLPNGKVLVAGGVLDWNGPHTNKAELYNPATGLWTPVTNMPAARADHSATLLANGKVLITGGSETLTSSPLNTALLYNPETSVWTNTGTSMMECRKNNSSVRLLNNTVLVVAGLNLSSTEVYGSTASVFNSPAQDLPQSSNIIVTFYPNYVPVVTYPEPVADLAAEPIEGAMIKLTWTPSISSDASAYAVYYATAIAFLDYSDPADLVSHPAATWTSPALVSGKTYYFVVRAVNSSGNEETNTNIVSATALGSLTGIVKASIKIPQNGKKISGNRLMVMAEITAGSLSDVKQVLFEYKNNNESTTWTTIPPANGNHQNPDLKSPYFIQWDVQNLAAGKYNIRAVATDTSGNADPAPVYITVIADHNDPDMCEKKNEKGEHQKQEKICNQKNNTIKASDDEKNKITQLLIPKGCMTVDSTKVTMITNPVISVPVPERFSCINEFREITLESGKLQGEAELSMQFKDDDGDGNLDGTDIPIASLCVYSYNQAKKEWEKLPSTVNKITKTVIGKTTHFSLFALFGAPASDLAGIKVYPNPFKPSKGHTYVKFDNLTENTRIRIFTLAGDFVFEKEDIDFGDFIWTAVNQSGKEVASGVYICMITNDLGEKKILKIAVIR